MVDADTVRVDRPAQNLVEAASNGAIAAIKVVSSVAANLIAILGLITFLNEALSYLGGCVGVPQLSFKVRALDRSTINLNLLLSLRSLTRLVGLPFVLRQSACRQNMKLSSNIMWSFYLNVKSKSF